MGRRLRLIKEKWQTVKASKSFHSLIVFLLFVAVATLFWFILAMNDNVTKTFDVDLNIVNVPDSVTFINEPPKSIHVTLRDKGTNLLRSGMMKHPAIFINFRDFASQTYFRFSQTDLDAALKASFGSSAQIGSVSIDSLSLRYTTGKGVRIPIVVQADISAAPGNVIAGIPEPLDRVVRAYSVTHNVDTMTRVYTEPIVKRNLKETTEVEVALRPMAGVRYKPSKIKVVIPVEPMVKKDALATVKAYDVPEGVSLLLFPATVPVSYYVPMSHFNDEEVPVTVSVSYNDLMNNTSSRLPLSIAATQGFVANPQVGVENVEYTVVKE